MTAHSLHVAQFCSQYYGHNQLTLNSGQPRNYKMKEYYIVLYSSKVTLFIRDDVDDAGEEMAEEEAEDAQMQDMIALDIDAGEW